MEVVEVESSLPEPDILDKDEGIPHIPPNTEKCHLFPWNSSVWSPREVFPENTAFIDKRKKFCRERKTQHLSYSKTFDSEFVTDPSLCEQVFELSLYQTILFKSSGVYVRFTKGYTELSLQSKINKIDVSDELKKSMSSISMKCTQLLRDVGLLCDYIELDAEKDFFVLSEGKLTKVRFTVNVLSLSEQSQPWRTTKSDSEEECDNEGDYGYLKISSPSLRADQRKKESAMEPNTDTIREQEYQNPSTINVMLSMRNWVPAKEIFLNFMTSVANPNQSIYLLICHLGPLVETPRITLYQYMMSNQMRKLCCLPPETKEDSKHQIKMEAYGEFHYKENSDEESDDSTPEVAVVETTDFKYVTEKKEEDAKCKNKKVQIGGHAVCETPIPGPDYVQTIVIPVESESSDEEDERNQGNITETPKIHSLTNQKGQLHNKNIKDNNNDQSSEEKVNSRIELAESTLDEKSREINNDGATGGHDSCPYPPNQSQLLKLSMEEIWHHWKRNEGQFVYEEARFKDCLRNYIYDVPPLPRRGRKKSEKK